MPAGQAPRTGVPQEADRLGLLTAAAIAILSLVALGLLTTAGFAAGSGAPQLVHTAAALSMIWSALAYGLHRRAPARHRDLLPLLDIAAMATGTMAALILIYIAVVELLCRTVLFPRELSWRVTVWPSALLDLAALTAALLISFVRTRQRQIITAVFWVLLLAIVWISLQWPAAEQLDSGGLYLVPGRWPNTIMFAGTALLAVFTALAGFLEGRRRAAALPHRLADLVTPAQAWPGFRYSAGMVGALVLILACIYSVRPLTSLSTFTAAAALLALAHRKWNKGLAEVGLALITLGVVSLCMSGLQDSVWSAVGFEQMLTRAVLGLAVMTRFWYWLAGVWDQQLDDGSAWTTAGRLIRTAHRVGFLAGTTGLLMSLHLAFWPRTSFVLLPEMSASRWVWGLSADGLLVLALLGSMRATGKSTLGWLLLAALTSTAAFIIVRAPASLISQLWGLYWPAIMAGLAGMALAAGSRIRPTGAFRAIREPLAITGLMVAPSAAMTGAALVRQIEIPPGTPAITFALLAGSYLIAARWPGPAVFRVLSVLCAAAGLWLLRDAFGPNMLPSFSLYPALLGLAMMLPAMLRQGRSTAIKLQNTGSLLVIAALALGLLLR